MSTLEGLINKVTTAAQADASRDNPEAHGELLRSIQRLTLAAETPTETAKRILYQPPTNIALRLAIKFGLLDVVNATGSGSITASEIAKIKDVNESLIIRIMRVLTAVGICNEVGPSKYSPNDVTQEFTEQGLGNGVNHLFDTVMPAAAKAIECFKEHGLRVPQHANETPFAYAQKMTLFEWMKEYPEQREYFDKFMAGRRKDRPRWFQIFPVAEKLKSASRCGSKDVLIVDIGASHGHDLIMFKERYFDLPGRLVLQDLPETINSIQNLAPGIEAMTYDFFAPQPLIGARFYIFGTVCHDWSDEACVKFLSNTANAMDREHSTLLIYDYVVPETGASVRAAAVDLQMMCLCAGMERMERQWRSILQASGLELVQVWSSQMEIESVIEAKLI